MKELMNALGQVPQKEPIPGREADMARNNAGGFAFLVDKWTQLDRFLILGTAGGTYYVGERELTLENAECVKECAAEDGLRAVERIVDISDSGRAPKNDQAIFALAMCASYGDGETKKAALEALPKVCRIGTHLLMFTAFLKEMRGFGRSVKRALGRWYSSKEPNKLAEQVMKYRNRHGWTHRDILRLAHPRGPSIGAEVNDVFNWVAQPDEHEVGESTPAALAAFLELQTASDSAQAARLIAENPVLSHEMVPTHLKDARVWQAIMERGLGMTALIRNLPTMTRVGLLKPMSRHAQLAAERLADQDALKRQRVHPINLLIAYRTYAAGKSIRGTATWEPTQEIAEALQAAFYAAYNSLETLPKRVYVGVDVSGSMGYAHLCGVPGFSPKVAAAALAVCYARQFERAAVFGFSDRMKDLQIGAKTSIETAMERADAMDFGRTDCAMPMIHAMAENIEADAFVILTDNETWAGDVHPAEALRDYRRRTGIGAKLLVCGMASNGFSIADPQDGGMLDVVGFDTAVPRLMDDFLS